MRRENTGRSRTFIVLSAMTAALCLLLLFVYIRFDRSRTLYRVLQGLEGDPLAFSADSGFYEEGFTLELKPDSSIPGEDDIEIRYTVNGDEPTAESRLYDGGIDLSAVIGELQAEAAGREEKKREVIRQADEEAEAARIAQEQAEKDAAGQTAAGDPAGGAGQQKTKEDGSVQEQQKAGEEAGQKGSEETKPGLEEGRETWERAKWTAAADSGLRPEREQDGICVIPVRACLVQGEDRSRVVTRTYVVGSGVTSRYDVYVASVVTDSFNLFDYDHGIMIPGSHYEKDVENGVRPDRAGNFYQNGDDWIKDGHVTLFSPDGEVILEEDTGLSIAGYSSRILPTRTFRAEASKEKGSSDDYFHLDIFAPDTGSAGKEAPDQDSAGKKAQDKESAGNEAQDKDSGPSFANTSAQDQGSPDGKTGQLPDASINVFRKIKFRTHGIPQYHIRSVRNQYAKELTDEAGFPGLPQNRLGVMFLNGEFYTVCDITPSTTNDYLCRLFGLNVPEGIEKYSGSDVDVYTRTKIIKLFTADLTQPGNQKALEAAVDMDNYLFYFALEVLFNNADWPYNNVTVWRYLGEENPENPYSDGRIRFLVEDMDQILSNGLHGDPSRWSSELIDYLMKDKGNTFYHVMSCTRYRDTFLTYVEDLLRTSFEPEHACAVLDRLYGELKNEYVKDYGQEFWAEMEHTAEVTKNNVREKEGLYRENIKKYMGLSERYPVVIGADEGTSVTWNNMTVPPGESWSNEYYCGTTFTVTAVPEKGYRFAGWEIDGEPAKEEALSGEDGRSVVISSAATVRALSEKAE